MGSVEEKAFDVVVIGSGAGGGTVARELAPLARAGLRVAVLESGPRLRDEDATGRELEMATRLYFDAGGFLTRDGTMTLAFGRAWGGSTVVYTGTSLAIEPHVIERWGVPGLEYDDVRRRSEKYLAENGAHLLPEELLNDNNKLFRAGCRALGWRCQQFPVNVRGCTGAGVCNLGCLNGAKQGTNRVQLPEAERAGVVAVTNCHVERIADGACEAVVKDPGFGAPSSWPAGRYRVSAGTFVVSAGAVNTPALLLRSGLGARLPVLGRYFTAHPALILVAQHDRPITTHHGHPKSFYCDEFAAKDRFLLETCSYFPFTTAKSLGGFGAEPAALMARMDRLQMILALALDRAVPENRVTIDRRGNPVVDYRLSREVLDSLHEATRAATKIFFAGGARRVHSPSGRTFFIEREQMDRVDQLLSRDELAPGKTSISAAHLMGGARMGDSAADSVTNAWGEVHGVPNLFVADASLFPSCSEINPYVTIMALADRVAERVRERVLAGAKA